MIPCVQGVHLIFAYGQLALSLLIRTPFAVGGVMWFAKLTAVDDVADSGEMDTELRSQLPDCHAMFFVQFTEYGPLLFSQKFGFLQYFFQLFINSFALCYKVLHFWGQEPVPPLNVPKPPVAGTLPMVPLGRTVV